MAKLNVNPTRMELSKLKKRLTTTKTSRYKRAKQTDARGVYRNLKDASKQNYRSAQKKGV